MSLTVGTKTEKRSQYHNSTTDAFLEKQNERPYIIHKKLKYIWNFESENFELLQNWDERPYDEVLNAPTLTTDLIETRRNLYGINKIDVSLTPIMRLVLNGNERALKKTVCISSKVTVCRRRDGEDDFMLVDSTELVPGDLIAIPSSGCLMQCDAVLLMGNCIVNESSLTGVSSQFCLSVSLLFGKMLTIFRNIKPFMFTLLNEYFEIVHYTEYLWKSVVTGGNELVAFGIVFIFQSDLRSFLRLHNKNTHMPVNRYSVSYVPLLVNAEDVV
ncbi:unnamed protein product [Schistosoma margrebowiei]|uniref:P-type ATPase A domain-containing protein n=1 Tax=Schistosoma margrebowiei TaxID=48269 RepID=A0A183M066_9TREM|nr:unnamed protein product [Schistosoma margrebowiei]